MDAEQLMLELGVKPKVTVYDKVDEIVKKQVFEDHKAIFKEKLGTLVFQTNNTAYTSTGWVIPMEPGVFNYEESTAKLLSEYWKKQDLNGQKIGDLVSIPVFDEVSAKYQDDDDDYDPEYVEEPEFTRCTIWDEDLQPWDLDIFRKTPDGYWDTEDWEKRMVIRWPALANTEELNPTQAASAYYLLQYMRYNLGGLPDVEGAVADAEKKFHDLCEKWDRIFLDYLAMAVGGEIRHHPAFKFRVLPEERWQAWCVWRRYWDTYGVDCLDFLGEMFGEWNEGTSVGGPRWRDAALVLKSRLKGELGRTEESNRAMFVDRVFTLEHNGGCFLNKITWQGNIKDLRKVFAAHSSNPPNLQMLLLYANPTIRDLWNEYWGDNPDNPISQKPEPEPEPPVYEQNMPLAHCTCETCEDLRKTLKR